MTLYGRWKASRCARHLGCWSKERCSCSCRCHVMDGMGIGSCCSSWSCSSSWRDESNRRKAGFTRVARLARVLSSPLYSAATYERSGVGVGRRRRTTRLGQELPSETGFAFPGRCWAADCWREPTCWRTRCEFFFYDVYGRFYFIIYYYFVSITIFLDNG